MPAALSLLVAGALLNIVAFLAARYVAARRLDAGGLRVALSIDPYAWREKTFGRRLLFALSGPAASYAVAASLIALGTLLGGKIVVDDRSMRIHVAAGTPASDAGLRDGDRIVSVSTVKIADWDQVRAEVKKHAGEPIEVVVAREGVEMTLTPTPSALGRIGIQPPSEHTRAGAADVAEAFIAPAKVNVATFQGLSRVVYGSEKVELQGPVAIAREADKRSDSFGDLLRLTGALSSYYLFFPLLLGLALFPRTPKPRRI